MEHAALIEILDRAGGVRSVHKVQSWPLTVGRSPDCDLVLSDPHLAGLHARLDWTETGAQLHLLESLNGGWSGERRLHSGDSAQLGLGAPFQLGLTQLRLRSSAQALTAEVPLDAYDELDPRRAPRRHWALLPLLLLVWLGLIELERWAALDPSAGALDYVGALLVALGAVLAWALLWSLITQLFRRRFPFMQHLRRVVIVVLVTEVLSVLVPLLAYALSLPSLMVFEGLSVPLIATYLIWWQAELVWPRARRSMALVFSVVLVAGFGLTVARRQEQQYWFQPSYLSALPPPMFRLAHPKPASALIDDLKSLQAPLQAQADKDSAGNPLDDDGDAE